MKTGLFLVIIILVLVIAFLWMFIAGADESKLRHENKHFRDDQENNSGEKK